MSPFSWRLFPSPTKTDVSSGSLLCGGNHRRFPPYPSRTKPDHVGDGQCDDEWDCPLYGYDNEDCAPPGDGGIEGCEEGLARTCGGECLDNEDLGDNVDLF